MILAVQSDFKKVKSIFYSHKKWFPHVRTDYMKRMIAKKQMILEDGILITFHHAKRRQKIGDVQLQKLTYVPHPVLIKQSEIQSTKTNRNDLIKLLSEDFHKNVRTDLETHGWSYGSDHDVIKMTDPLIVEYSKLNIGEKEMYIEQAAYVLSLIKIAGYNIVGPLTEEQLESRRSSKFTKLNF